MVVVSIVFHRTKCSGLYTGYTQLYVNWGQRFLLVERKTLNSRIDGNSYQYFDQNRVTTISYVLALTTFRGLAGINGLATVCCILGVAICVRPCVLKEVPRRTAGKLHTETR